MHITYKKVGETPLECLKRLRAEENISLEVPMTYAGRLDPMAEGQLIILIGDECKEKNKYTDLDKEYEVEVLLGVETDSYDVLGVINKVYLNKKEPDLGKFIGKFDQKYPIYSSKIISMKEIPDEMPVKEVEIYSIESLGNREIKGQDISKEATEKIGKVKGDFRQNEIIKRWNEFNDKYGQEIFKIIKIKVVCSSGTYMRSLAQNMGGLAFSINRIKIMLK
ncbi:MAG TPA: hypothetical protein VJI66_00920 [Candidatus Paceibacterota bacterium]